MALMDTRNAIASLRALGLRVQLSSYEWSEVDTCGAQVARGWSRQVFPGPGKSMASDFQQLLDEVFDDLPPDHQPLTGVDPQPEPAP